MPSEWITRRFQQQSQEEQDRQTQDRMQLHRAEVIKSRGPGWNERLLKTIELQVSEYNETLGKKVQFQRKPSGGFRIDQPDYPAVYVTGEVHGGAMQFTVLKVANAHSGTATVPFTTDFEVDNGDNLICNSGIGRFSEPELLAEAILDRAF